MVRVHSPQFKALTRILRFSTTTGSTVFRTADEYMAFAIRGNLPELWMICGLRKTPCKNIKKRSKNLNLMLEWRNWRDARDLKSRTLETLPVRIRSPVPFLSGLYGLAVTIWQRLDMKLSLRQFSKTR